MSIQVPSSSHLYLLLGVCVCPKKAMFKLSLGLTINMSCQADNGRRRWAGVLKAFQERRQLGPGGNHGRTSGISGEP